MEAKTSTLYQKLLESDSMNVFRMRQRVNTGMFKTREDIESAIMILHLISLVIDGDIKTNTDDLSYIFKRHLNELKK